MNRHMFLWLVIGWLIGLFFPPTIVTSLVKGAAGGA
jgi:hypothetical protein